MKALLSMEASATQRCRVIGRHVYGSAYECNVQKLMDADFLLKVVEEASRVGGFTLIDVRAWRIPPGVSVVGIVVESHISVHTWPEHAFATIDVYTCGEKGDPERAFDYIAEALEAKSVTKGYIDRSMV